MEDKIFENNNVAFQELDKFNEKVDIDKNENEPVIKGEE